MGSDAHALGANLVEGLADGSVQVVELALHLVLWRGWVNELHLVDLIHDVAILLTREEHLDLGHGHLLLGALLSVDNGADGALVEHHDGLHHANGLPQGAVVVVLREGVLLQELILNDGGGLSKQSSVMSQLCQQH